jgi:uncharacterized membrane protein YccF (DUF307 family)
LAKSSCAANPNMVWMIYCGFWSILYFKNIYIYYIIYMLCVYLYINRVTIFVCALFCNSARVSETNSLFVTC